MITIVSELIPIPDDIKLYFSQEPFMISFTRTEERILRVLSDGASHTKEELKAVIDSEANDQNLRDHICKMRKKLQPAGHDIICEIRYKKALYRHVLMLYSEGDSDLVDLT